MARVPVAGGKRKRSFVHRHISFDQAGDSEYHVGFRLRIEHHIERVGTATFRHDCRACRFGDRESGRVIVCAGHRNVLIGYCIEGVERAAVIDSQRHRRRVVTIEIIVDTGDRDCLARVPVAGGKRKRSFVHRRIGFGQAGDSNYHVGFRLRIEHHIERVGTSVFRHDCCTC